MSLIDKFEKSEKYTFRRTKNVMFQMVNLRYVFFQYSIYEYLIFFSVNVQYKCSFMYRNVSLKNGERKLLIWYPPAPK